MTRWVGWLIAANVVAFILQANTFAAGRSELGTTDAARFVNEEKMTRLESGNQSAVQF